jgi:hypothetical protein
LRLDAPFREPLTNTGPELRHLGRIEVVRAALLRNHQRGGRKAGRCESAA